MKKRKLYKEQLTIVNHGGNKMSWKIDSYGFLYEEEEE